MARILPRIIRRLLSGCHLLFTRENLMHRGSGAQTDGDIHIIANYAKHATNRGLIREICAGVPYDAFLCSIDVCMNNYELWIDFSISDAILAWKDFLLDRDPTTYLFKRTRESRGTYVYSIFNIYSDDIKFCIITEVLWLGL